MSHTIIIDESNGNGLCTIKTSGTTTSSSVEHPSNNGALVLAMSSSNEDLSQSLSEYTDADESLSAPTEFLAEFLSAVMLKDYRRGLSYCKLILQYEPNNSTAKEFYPLILEKLKHDSSSESDENYNKSIEAVDNNEAGLVSLSGEADHLSLEEMNSSDSEDIVSNSSDSEENQADTSSGSNVSTRSTESRSENNTTHSYSSLLLEEDYVPQIPALKEQSNTDLDFNNGNFKSTSCSNSSPTEPLTQRLVAILRSKYVVPAPKVGNN